MRNVLLLNAGCGEVLSVIPWTRALNLILKGRAYAKEVYEEFEIPTSRHRDMLGIMAYPAVLVLGDYIYLPFDKRVPVKKVNLMVRDNGECQYCGKQLSHGQATIDHITPVSRGGKHEWKNVVLSCKECNNRKANRLLREAGMKPRSRPYIPTRAILYRKYMKQPRYERWIPYLEPLLV